MKRPLKITLLTLTGIVTISAFLWMRSLASWRPQKIGTLAKGYSPAYVSQDGRFVTAFSIPPIGGVSPLPSSPYKSFDLKTRQSKSWAWTRDVDGEVNSGSGQSGDFYWAFKRVKGANYSVELKEMATGQLKHTLIWGPIEYDVSLTIAVVGRSLCVLSRHDFREFDLTTDKLKRPVILKHSLEPSPKSSPLFAISPDAKTLYGCLGPDGIVWDSATGKPIKQWKATGVPNTRNPNLFSPDGRVVVYLDLSSKSPTRCYFVDSTTGK